MDEATRKAVDKIEKLMRLAGSNPNEAEAASALQKAQALLVAYNLDMAVVEQASGQSGKRLDEMVSGGMHRYQRNLWRHIAELNFCMYWTQKNRVRDGSYQAKKGRKWTHEHRLVGRTVNVASTKGMACYLDQTIERLCREMLGGERSMQYYSSDAVAFREGVADRVIEKICDRRAELVDADRRKKAEAERKAAEAGISLSMELTISGLSEAEEAGNYDFLHGEGAWAKRKAWEAESEARWAERREARAKAEAEAEAAAAAWAAAHPEEAAEAAKKERARQRARDRAAERRALSGGGGRYRFRETKEEMRRGSSAYHAGYKKGADVGIDPQVNPSNIRKIG
jgi:hypothetical protein